MNCGGGGGGGGGICPYFTDNGTPTSIVSAFPKGWKTRLDRTLTSVSRPVTVEVEPSGSVVHGWLISIFDSLPSSRTRRWISCKEGGGSSVCGPIIMTSSTSITNYIIMTSSTSITSYIIMTSSTSITDYIIMTSSTSITSYIIMTSSTSITDYIIMTSSTSITSYIIMTSSTSITDYIIMTSSTSITNYIIMTSLTSLLSLKNRLKVPGEVSWTEMSKKVNILFSPG